MRRRATTSSRRGRLLSRLLLTTLTISLAVANTSNAAGSVSLGIETSRRAFYRGEEIRLSVSCFNETDKTIAGTLTADFGGCVTASDRVADLAPGGQATLSFKFPTLALKADQYVLNFVLTNQSTVLAEMHEPFVVAKKPRAF